MFFSKEQKIVQRLILSSSRNTILSTCHKFYYFCKFTKQKLFRVTEFLKYSQKLVKGLDIIYLGTEITRLSLINTNLVHSSGEFTLCL